jgi:UDP-N-acetylglucosamine 4,6-dehydratase/5-epimerase
VNDIDGREILITGGTGSLGKALVKLLKARFKPRGIRVYSRSELKQSEMIADVGKEHIAYIIGDVRDSQALTRACKGVDIIINCAAMKRVETSEANPLECTLTNVNGAANLVYAALANDVDKVFHISTDKAVYPTTLYGSTKKVAEDIIIQANTYGFGVPRRPIFSCARYGNVFGSNGSVIHTFRKQAKQGKNPFRHLPTLTITDARMTRFWITLEEVARFILARISDMEGNEVYIPNMPSMPIVDIAKTVCPEAELDFIGIRGQEKIHECLVTEEESPYTMKHWSGGQVTHFEINNKKVPEDDRWSFCSGDNPWQLTRDELRKMLEEL